MIESLAWLALAVEDLERSREWYARVLGLESDPMDGRIGEYRLPMGTTALHLRGSDAARPGGQHVHYAFETGGGAIDRWRRRLAEHESITEHDFGVYRSLYCFDPDRHCVEIAGRDRETNSLARIFEVVLEVADLERATAFYRSLGCSVRDRGDKRRRVRLDAGAIELELWEPQRGLADARPGREVELGVELQDAESWIATARDRGADVLPGSVVRDADGHRYVVADLED